MPEDKDDDEKPQDRMTSEVKLISEAEFKKLAEAEFKKRAEAEAETAKPKKEQDR